ncbi:MAG: hypothetical protein ABWY07_08355, partial [Burkholderiales bacterium]
PALVAAVARRGDATSQSQRFNAQRFAWCWASAVLVFFSLSSSKLPPYILPAIAGVALAAAPALARHWRRSLEITAWTLIVGGIVGIIAAVPAAGAIKVEVVRRAYLDNVGWILLGTVAFVATGALALQLLRRRPLGALACVVLGGMLGCQLAMVTAYHIDAYFSAERLIEGISGGEALRPFEPAVPFYSVDLFDHTVPYYLGRTVVLVKERGEMAWGIGRAPENFVAEMDTFSQRWRDERKAYAIMRLSTFDELTAAGLPMNVLAQDGRRIVVTRH